MHFVRDKVTLQVLTCGTDEKRLRRTASGSERLEVVEDRAAATVYINVPMAKEPGSFLPIHPYEAEGRKMLNDERDRLIAEWLERNSCR